jgi:hypothetical protein
MEKDTEKKNYPQASFECFKHVKGLFKHHQKFQSLIIETLQLMEPTPKGNLTIQIVVLHL